MLDGDWSSDVCSSDLCGAHRNNYANTRGILIYGHFSSLIDGFSSNPNVIGLFSLG
jgi:hypothetical protein